MDHESSQNEIALEEAADAVLRMIKRGVFRAHIPPSALVMVGIGLMEHAVSRQSIGIWLRKLSDLYLANPN